VGANDDYRRSAWQSVKLLVADFGPTKDRYTVQGHMDREGHRANISGPKSNSDISATEVSSRLTAKHAHKSYLGNVMSAQEIVPQRSAPL
jgi:hypothetical protein